MEKQNCWEIKKCGREPGGEIAGKDGPCPAATDPFFHGVNNGINGGRYCWRLEGTTCRQKLPHHQLRASTLACSQCEVLIRVIREEGSFFRL